MLDAAIILAYFATILIIGIRSRGTGETSAAEYFLSSRSLTWPAIAMSTIATNISSKHFIAAAGSGYKDGFATANFEINAIFGICLAAFVFVPMYLRAQVTTITEFFEAKFGVKVALAYSTLMLALYGFLYLGAALFWSAYAVDTLFPDLVAFIHPNSQVRLCVIIAFLGGFSAFYTYLGGLTAVVRTDKVQFMLLLVGGLVTVGFVIHELGGFSELWNVASLKYPSDHPMHLHLPATDDKIPWIALIGMNLLNLNYWGANQVILQRALAAKNLRHAQLGLIVGGLFKYFMVFIIIIPAIALLGILDKPLADPDQAYATMINSIVPAGIRGLILCGLFASMMSTVDSIFNSLSTLFSIDIYKRHLRKNASDADVVATGKKVIGVALFTGIAFAYTVVYLKAGGSEKDALTHFFNEIGYYVKNGFVVLIVSATFLVNPARRLVLAALFASIGVTVAFKVAAPEMNYLVRAGWSIVLSTAIVAVPTWIQRGFRFPATGLFEFSTRRVALAGALLFLSLVLTHVVFH